MNSNSPLAHTEARFIFARTPFYRGKFPLEPDWTENDRTMENSDILLLSVLVPNINWRVAVQTILCVQLQQEKKLFYVFATC